MTVPTALAVMLAVCLAHAAKPQADEPPAEAPAPPVSAPPTNPALAAPAPTPAGGPGNLLKKVAVEPFASIVGGLKLDTIIESPQEHRVGRLSAIMVSDFGLRGKIGDTFYFDSELLAGGGGGGDPNTLPGFELHGSSAWNGQAQLQVRQQLVGAASGIWRGEVGRIIDEGSVDFMSSHVGDTLFQDTALVYQFLYTGFLLGNGLRGSVDLLPESVRDKHSLRLGLAFLGGNPVSQTGSLIVGGGFPPFSRFYIQPYQNVKQTPDNSPDDTFQMMTFAPSLVYAGPLADVRAEFQGYVVDTNTNDSTSQSIHGYNARGSARLKLLDDTISPFGNLSVDRNDTVNPANTSQLANDKYISVAYGGGVDFNYAHQTPTKPDGVGVQYERVAYQVGSVCDPAANQVAGCITNLHFINVGTTYWLNDWVAVGARFAVWLVNQVNVHDEGERSAIVTLRMEL